MNKTKKIVSLIIIVILSFVILFTYIYLFNEAQKLAKSQLEQARISKELELAKEKLENEKKRLNELRGQSYFGQVSQTQYTKTKKLVEQTNVFFKNPESDQPEIQIPTKNKIIETEINSKRAKINEILKIWSTNNANSIETDEKLIAEIKTYLLIIESYMGQLQTIVSNLSTNNSELTNEEISTYTALVENSSEQLTEVIATINQAAITISKTDVNAQNEESEEIQNQIEVVIETQENIIDLENLLQALQSISTTTIINETSTSTIATTTTVIITRKPRLFYEKAGIIYQSNPAPYRDNGVDVLNTKPTTPLQDW